MYQVNGTSGQAINRPDRGGNEDAANAAHGADRQLHPDIARDREGDRRARIDATLASLHLVPGAELPEWFERYPACQGVGCRHCDHAGRMHPRRVAWLNNALVDVHYADLVFRHLQYGRQAGTAAAAEVQLALGKLAMAFLEDWAADEDDPPTLDEMLLAEARRALDRLARAWPRADAASRFDSDGCNPDERRRDDPGDDDCRRTRVASGAPDGR